MSKLKQLVEKASQKNEMRWRVYAYDPAKDNKLVHTSKDFENIEQASAEKLELLKKNPDYTIELIAESKKQKNEAETITIGSGNGGDYYDYNGTRYVLGRYVTQYLIPKLKGKKLNFIKGINSFKSDRTNKVPVSDDFFNRMKDNLLKELNKSESAQKDLANHLLQVLSKGGATLKQLQDFESKGYSNKDLSDTLKTLVQQGKVKTSFEGGTTRYVLVESQKNESKVNMSKLKNDIQAAVNKYFKDDKDLLEYVYVDTKKDKFGRDVLEVRAELGYNNMVKLADYLDKIVTKYDKYAYFDQETSGTMTAVFESSQKNEATFKPGDKVKVDFNWRGVKPSIKEVVILNKRHLGGKDFDEDEYEVKLSDGKTMWVNTQAVTESANIDVKNPGVLEVPDGKKVNELPQSHFEKLVDKKGYAEVIRALTNLEVWNKDKNKSLSSWASNMADKLKKKYRPESVQYKFKVGDRVLYEGDKATIKELKTSGTGSLEKPYYSVEKDKEKGKMTHPAREFELKLIGESSQKNETRGYKVLVELGVPDNMNNRDIEDEVERLLRSSHKIDVVLDVTAERN